MTATESYQATKRSVRRNRRIARQNHKLVQSSIQHVFHACA